MVWKIPVSGIIGGILTSALGGPLVKAMAAGMTIYMSNNLFGKPVDPMILAYTMVSATLGIIIYKGLELFLKKKGWR